LRQKIVCFVRGKKKSLLHQEKLRNGKDPRHGFVGSRNQIRGGKFQFHNGKAQVNRRLGKFWLVGGARKMGKRKEDKKHSSEVFLIKKKKSHMEKGEPGKGRHMFGFFG